MDTKMSSNLRSKLPGESADVSQGDTFWYLTHFKFDQQIEVTAEQIELLFERNAF